MRLISAGSLVRAQSGPFLFRIGFSVAQLGSTRLHLPQGGAPRPLSINSFPFALLLFVELIVAVNLVG
jgi:hypothetical protein